jgi:hypothetical protein
MPDCKYRGAIWYETIYSNTRRTAHKMLEYTLMLYFTHLTNAYFASHAWAMELPWLLSEVHCEHCMSGDGRSGLPPDPCASAIGFRSVPGDDHVAPARDTLDLQPRPRSLAMKARPELPNVRLGDWQAQGASGELRPTERLKIAPARAYHGPGMGEQDAQYRPR